MASECLILLWCVRACVYACVCVCVRAVCVVAGYVMSYWNRPFFPEGCGDYQLDDPDTYDTLVRSGGSWGGFANAIKVIIDMYGWKHVVLVSDISSSVCYFGAEPFNNLFEDDDNYTFSWLRFTDDPDVEELDDLLDQIRARTRGP